jgi:glycosyltransferase involved in cell wall biosynthesis
MNRLAVERYLQDSFTVLMPVYIGDSAVRFRRALDSIKENSLSPDALLIVVDGPVQAPVQSILDELSVQRDTTVLVIEHNVGLADALNYALSFVETNFVIRADADDFNVPNRFAKIISQLRNGYDLVGSNIDEFSSDGFFVATRRVPLKSDDILKFSRRRNPFNHMSVGFRISVFRSVGGYPKIHLKEDYALWSRMLHSGCAACNIDESLVFASAGTEMYARRGGLKYVLSEAVLQKYLVSIGAKTLSSAFIDGLLRSIVFLAPISLRGYVYRKFLRN